MSIIKKFPRLVIGCIVVALLFLVITVAEIALRKSGYVPGIPGRSFWLPVDTLFNLKGFTADNTGIMRVSPEAAQEINRLTMSPESFETIVKIGPEFKKNNPAAAAIGVAWNFHKLNSDLEGSEFGRFIQAISNKPADARTILERAYLAYSQNPINEFGFRSIAFPDSGYAEKPTVLFIGDSFTWGSGADHLYDGFADLLATKGYAVYNTGIAGADPSQYLAIAQLLIPRLRPDFVLVAFYEGNDVVFFQRQIIAGQPHFYVTNYDWLDACPHGLYFPDADSAYSFNKRFMSIPGKENNLLLRFLSSTVLGTQAWSAMVNAGILQKEKDAAMEAYWEQVGKLSREEPYSEAYILAIDSIARAVGSKMKVAIIELNPASNKLPENFMDGVFKTLPVVYCKDISAADYASDGHYNNEGHKKFATFIDQLLKEN